VAAASQDDSYKVVIPRVRAFELERINDRVRDLLVLGIEALQDGEREIRSVLAAEDSHCRMQLTELSGRTPSLADLERVIPAYHQRINVRFEPLLEVVEVFPGKFGVFEKAEALLIEERRLLQVLLKELCVEFSDRGRHRSLRMDSSNRYRLKKR
jgi:hypothetical protein